MFRQYALYYLRTSRNAHISSGLVMVGLALILGAWSIASQWKWKPVNSPLPLHGPVALNISFVAHTPSYAYYLIKLESSLPTRHWDEEEAAPSLPLQHFTVKVDGKEVETHSADTAQAKLERKIIGFSAKAGQECTIHLDSKPLPTELHAWHPHLVVEVPPDGGVVLPQLQAGLFVLLGLSLVIGGTCTAFGTMCKEWISYRALFVQKSESSLPQ